MEADRSGEDDAPAGPIGAWHEAVPVQLRRGARRAARPRVDAAMRRRAPVVAVLDENRTAARARARRRRRGVEFADPFAGAQRAGVHRGRAVGQDEPADHRPGRPMTVIASPRGQAGLRPSPLGTAGHRGERGDRGPADHGAVPVSVTTSRSCPRSRRPTRCCRTGTVPSAARVTGARRRRSWTTRRRRRPTSVPGRGADLRRKTGWSICATWSSGSPSGRARRRRGADCVLAVNEVASNSVEHGPGRGPAADVGRARRRRRGRRRAAG